MATKVADDYPSIAKRLAELEAAKIERMNEPTIPEPAEVPEYSGWTADWTRYAPHNAWSYPGLTSETREWAAAAEQLLDAVIRPVKAGIDGQSRETQGQDGNG